MVIPETEKAELMNLLDEYLPHIVTVYQQSISDDDEGVPIQTWSTVRWTGNCRLTVQFVRPYQYEVASVERSVSFWTITIRGDKFIDHTDRVKVTTDEGDRWFEVMVPAEPASEFLIEKQIVLTEVR